MGLEFRVGCLTLFKEFRLWCIYSCGIWVLKALLQPAFDMRTHRGMSTAEAGRSRGRAGVGGPEFKVKAFRARIEITFWQVMQQPE